MTSQASSLTLSDALSLYEREFLASRNLAPLTRQAYLGDLSSPRFSPTAWEFGRRHA